MTDAAVTARSTPVGVKLGDGFATKIAFALDPDVSFWERSVTPLGFEGGDPVDTSTMFNTTWRTKASRSLKESTDISGSAGYDPRVYDQIVTMINQDDQITIHFPDSSTIAFWGFLKTFTPAELVEGTFPEASFTIVALNVDSAGLETGPNYISPTGTD